MIKFSGIGIIGRDAELKNNENSTWVNFSVAINKRVKNQNETVWVSCVIFGNRATSLHQYLTKGTKVYIEGEPTFKIGQTKDGQALVRIDVMIKEIELIGQKQKNDSAHTMNEFLNSPSQITSNDDIPF